MKPWQSKAGSFVVAVAAVTSASAKPNSLSYSQLAADPIYGCEVIATSRQRVDARQCRDRSTALSIVEKCAENDCLTIGPKTPKISPLINFVFGALPAINLANSGLSDGPKEAITEIISDFIPDKIPNRPETNPQRDAVSIDNMYNDAASGDDILYRIQKRVKK